MLKIQKGEDSIKKYKPFVHINRFKEKPGFYVEAILREHCTYLVDKNVRETNTLYGFKWQGNNEVSIDWKFSGSYKDGIKRPRFQIYARWVCNGVPNVRYLGDARFGDSFSCKVEINKENQKVNVAFVNSEIGYRRSCYINWDEKFSNIMIGRYLFPKLRATPFAHRDMWFALNY